MQYVFPTSVFLGPHSLMGLGGGVASRASGGQVVLVAAAAVDIRLLMKGALRVPPAAEVGWRLSRAVQRSSRSGGTPLRRARGPAEIWEKQGTCAVCRLLHGLAGCQVCGHRLRPSVLGNERDFQAICRQGLILSAHVHIVDPTKKYNLNCGDATGCLGTGNNKRHQEETCK